MKIFILKFVFIVQNISLIQQQRFLIINVQKLAGLRCCGYNRIVEKSASYVRDEKTGRFRDFTSINLPEQKQTE